MADPRAGLDEVASGVYRYGSRYINCYVIEEGGRLTFLDVGRGIRKWPSCKRFQTVNGHGEPWTGTVQEAVALARKNAAAI